VPVGRPPCQRPGPLDATKADVRALLSVLDGSIQVPAVRRRLRQSWGLCSRHAWLLAVTEIELRGGVPFTTAVLYEDLLQRAARVLGRRLVTVSWRVGSLRSPATCIACDGSEAAATWDPAAEAETGRVNRRARTTAGFRATALRWQHRSCPRCLGGSGPLCRPHLLAGEPVAVAPLAHELERLALRLRRERRTAWAPTADAPLSSWVEALGWFAGWWFPVDALGLGGRTTG
jgi:hypothetical protein